MDNRKVIKYMNPITFEAEMFTNTLEELSTTYSDVDVNLISSLEKVINTIQKFLDKSKSEILATETIKLEKANIQDITRIYHCKKCKMDLGKSADKVTLHLLNSCPSGNSLRKPQSEALKNRKTTKLKKSSKKLSKKTLALLATNYEEFYAENKRISDKLKFLPEYDNIESDLMCIINPLFPKQNLRIYRFGSRISGIGSQTSDLDFFIDIGNNFNNFQNRADSKTLENLLDVSEALKRKKTMWKNLITIQRARVPILRVTHSDTSIECDLNFSDSLGVMNTQLLDYLFTRQPIARAMCIFMKKWLNRTGLNSEFSSYSITMLVIFYLQSIDLLPTLERLQRNVDKEKGFYVGPWLCTFEMLSLNELNIPLEPISYKSLRDHIQDFFFFYTEYDYKNVIICPYFGKAIKRSELDSLMPESYTKYVQDFPDYALLTASAMVIQDPIQLNHNLTKSITSSKLATFSDYVLQSLKALDK